jgi:hypothetical protein
MEGSCMRVDACRPVTTANQSSCCYLNCCCKKRLPTELLLLLLLLLLPCLLFLLLLQKRVLPCTATASQPGPSPSTTPGCNPLLIRALLAWIARRLHCVYFLLLYCPAAFDNAAHCHQRYGSKQRGGRPRRWGSVFCRSMENSVGEGTRRQLAEARGIGRLI